MDEAGLVKWEMYVGWLDGRPLGWVGWLADRLVGWLAGERLACWLAGLGGWLAGSHGLLACWLLRWLVGLLVGLLGWAG